MSLFCAAYIYNQKLAFTIVTWLKERAFCSLRTIIGEIVSFIILGII